MRIKWCVSQGKHSHIFLSIFQFHALCVLHKSSYDLSKAVGCLVPSGGPVLCRDEMEEWSAGTGVKLSATCWNRFILGFHIT